MQEYINREIEARLKIENEYRALLDRAAEENRDLTPEEDEQGDKLVAASNRHKERINQLQQMAEAANAGADVRAFVNEVAVQAEEPQGFNLELQSAIRTIFTTYQQGGEVPGEINLREIAAGRAPWEWRALESVAGVNMPSSDFPFRVAVYARTLSPWLGASTIVNGTNGAPLPLPRLTADATTYTPGQGTAITESNPTITATTATPSSYKALTAVSQEMAEDEVIQLMNLIANSQGRSIGLSFGSVTTAAVIAAATNGGTATGTPFFTLDDLIDLVYGRAVPTRMNGSFVMATGAVSKARKFKDSNGQYLWEPSNQSGEPDRLLGYPVLEDPNLATPASATKSVIFGDTSAYVIKQLPLRVAVSSEYLFNTDQVAIKTVYRAGGGLADTTALAYLVSGNT